MNRKKGQAAGRKAARIRWPLACSAAFHLLAISGLFALGPGPYAGWSRGVVDVLLVGGAGDPPPAAPPPTMRPQGSIEGKMPRSPEGKASAGAVVPKGRVNSVEDRSDLEDPGPPASLSAPGAQSAEGAGGPARGEGPPSFPDPGEETSPPGRGMTNSASPRLTAAVLDPGPTVGGSGAGRGMTLLRERIRSRIVYPAEALRRGLEGEVLLRIRIEKGGNVGEVRVARSSGARILDDAARRGAIRAAPLPSDPGWVEIPVLFRLR